MTSNGCGCGRLVRQVGDRCHDLTVQIVDQRPPGSGLVAFGMDRAADMQGQRGERPERPRGHMAREADAGRHDGHPRFEREQGGAPVAAVQVRRIAVRAALREDPD